MYLSAGTLLQRGKYKIVRYISHGGFGCTYEALNTTWNNRRVAIKELFISEFCDRDATTGTVSLLTESKRQLFDKLRGKFLDEADKLNGLTHPGIVRVTDAFEENGTAYYVMDYIEGDSLKEVVKKRGALSEEEAVGYIRQAADALQYVHACKLLHLDIKPANVMLRPDGVTVLIDFGVSKQYDEENGENTSTLMGHSPGYAPPEQMNNRVGKFLPSTDIYALGATLYTLLSGVVPPSANDIAAGEELTPLPANISAATRRAVESAMIINKFKRPQSVADFLALLDGKEAAADDEKTNLRGDLGGGGGNDRGGSTAGEKTNLGVGGNGNNGGTQPGGGGNNGGTTPKPQPVPTPKPQPTPKRKRNLKWLWITLAVVVLGVLGAVGYLWMSGQELIRQETYNAQNGPKEYVDLGLPSGLKWATCNIGAYSPEEYGNYYAWGETTTKSKYIHENSQTNGKNLGDISGDARYDAARANWGGSWRMPTRAEFEELIDHCDWQWTTQNGVEGMRVTGKNGNSIFLPAAGWRNRSSQNNAGENGYYWSSTPYEDGYGTDGAYYLLFGSGYYRTGWGYKYGHTVRPVSD